MLMFETHKLDWDANKPTSQEREISIKSSPMSLILSTTAGKSHLIHLVDTPGHVNFIDEVPLAIRLVDGVLLVVDVVEGLMVGTEAINRCPMQENRWCLSPTTLQTYKPSVPLDGFFPEDEEDMVESIVEDLLISEARYFTPTDEIPAGNLVLIGGV
ncbi:P-loop containing nucleoside triphosphate hydrolase protein [Lentinula aff. lateritia]|uniref:P-loop containing nucleoside triphosphate hydrolase protein n=1 Tax=Lentinula aff. lateritia TaxID=2804960 RepID=A0ACC1TIS0_9AGAR|nr:P-loop containing nucleoside triphosphate hydrolase protein [Lentinula aff. lateritia]